MIAHFMNMLVRKTLSENQFKVFFKAVHIFTFIYSKVALLIWLRDITITNLPEITLFLSPTMMLSVE